MVREIEIYPFISIFQSMEVDRRHQCLIYEGAPSRLLPALAATIQHKLSEGRRCLYLNSRPMVAGMRSYLAAIGVDVVYEIAKARLVLSSEPVTAYDGGFDVDLMLLKLEDALDQALSDGYSGLWATGDMTWEFGHQKNLKKLLEYERGLEGLMQRRPELSGICQYHQDTLPREATRIGLLTHQFAYINDTLSRINPQPISGCADVQKTSDSELDVAVTELCHLQELKS
jgi:hypothetical protein